MDAFLNFSLTWCITKAIISVEQHDIRMTSTILDFVFTTVIRKFVFSFSNVQMFKMEASGSIPSGGDFFNRLAKVIDFGLLQSVLYVRD